MYHNWLIKCIENNFKSTSSGTPFTNTSDYIHYKEWDDISYPFLNFNDTTVEV